MKIKRVRRNIHPLRDPTARDLLKIADGMLNDADAEDIGPMPSRGVIADLLAAHLTEFLRARNNQAVRLGVVP